MVTISDIVQDEELVTFVDSANSQLAALGYTEHGRRHAGMVGETGERILLELGFSQREGQLAHIAGYLHDVGNLIHRSSHALSGAMIAYQGLRRLGMLPVELATVMGAIGNHEEEHGIPVSPVAAAVVLADKADVHRSRVQNPDMESFDVHDRVNYAVTESNVRVDSEHKVIALDLVVDVQYAQVMNYFEIFLSRMVMMREAARVLDCDYNLIMNGTRLS